ncbi:MFS transporter [Actinomadura roseirufa]|uniref:MFS transporter n=1 Tax=Actinomadura roseirufa TaxID=2094049 RepID=UPI0013F16396|nr:MFS transporter [Actinomadura roseirufa]
MNGNDDRRNIGPYRAVVTLPGWWVWFACMALIRLPVTMAPLTFVLLGGHLLGSYAAGGLLAAGHALGEALFAPWLGRRLDRRPVAAELRGGLAVQTVLFALMAASAAVLPLWPLVAAAFLAGGAASGAPGGMRALMASWVPEERRKGAMSLESSLNQAMWAGGPAVAATTATLLSPITGLVVMAVAGAVPALLAHRIRGARDRPSVPEAADRRPLHAVLGPALPALLLGAAVMYLVGALDITLPARLDELHRAPALAGALLSAFAVASIAGGLLYGLRSWPGGYQAQAVALLLGMAGCVLAVAFLSDPWALFAVLVVAGILNAPVLTARNLVLQQRLPQHDWATGFSALYASGGVGYGASGLLVASLLDLAGPVPAIVTTAAGIGLIATGSAHLEARMGARERPDGGERSGRPAPDLVSTRTTHRKEQS